MSQTTKKKIKANHPKRKIYKNFINEEEEEEFKQKKKNLVKKWKKKKEE